MTNEQQLTAWAKHRQFLLGTVAGMTEAERRQWGVKCEVALRHAELQIANLEKEISDDQSRTASTPQTT